MSDIIMKHIVTENGKNIHVFDNLFTLDTRMHTYGIFHNSTVYRIGWHDSPDPRTQEHVFLHSLFTIEQAKSLPIYGEMSKSVAFTLLQDLNLVKPIVNLCMPTDSYFIHTHGEKKVALYYPNLDWQDGWHGETIFYTEDKKEVEYTSPYTPGRLIIFDGNIPHAIRPQSIIAPNHRFTFAMVFN